MTFQKPSRPVSRVFLHCSASDRSNHDNVETIRAWHKARGWSDIGYHFFVTRDGFIHPGRPLERTPVAQKGHNRGTIAICLHGLTYFTDAQYAALRSLCQEIDAAYDGQITFHEHNEVANKACPVYPAKRLLGLAESGRLGVNQSEENPQAEPARSYRNPPGVRTIRLLDAGADVAWVQTKLGLNPDGRFGRLTLEAVQEFQEEEGLEVDGVIGQRTWAALKLVFNG